MKELRDDFGNPKNKQTVTEDVTAKGKDLIEKIKEIIRAGNVRKITILTKSGEVIFTIPVTIGVIGIIIAPPLAILGLIISVVAEYTIRIERRDNI